MIFLTVTVDGESGHSLTGSSSSESLTSCSRALLGERSASKITHVALNKSEFLADCRLEASVSSMTPGPHHRTAYYMASKDGNHSPL